MRKTGLQNEELIGKILISGSLGIKSKSTYGINLFEEIDVKDGVTAAKLVKPKYDNAELLKSIDTQIVELIPITAPDLPDTVLRSIYNDATQSIINLTNEIQDLNVEISDLTGKVKELEIVSQSLRVEVDNEALIAAASQNQTTTATSKIQTTIVELQNAIQKATSEAIQRVSLFARNQSLKEQNDLLREELFGKKAKLEAGAVSTGDLATVKFEKAPLSNNSIDNKTYYIILDNDHGTLKGAGGISETLHSKFIEVYAVASDVTVELADALGVWEWTPSAKATVAKGKTQKFELKPSVKLNTKMDGGWRTWIGTIASRYNTYDSILKIKVSSEGKTTEEKEFLTRVYNYRL
jgi:hypothetical protein